MSVAPIPSWRPAIQHRVHRPREHTKKDTQRLSSVFRLLNESEDETLAPGVAASQQAVPRQHHQRLSFVECTCVAVHPYRDRVRPHGLCELGVLRDEIQAAHALPIFEGLANRPTHVQIPPILPLHVKRLEEFVRPDDRVQCSAGASCRHFYPVDRWGSSRGPEQFHQCAKGILVMFTPSPCPSEIANPACSLTLSCSGILLHLTRIEDPSCPVSFQFVHQGPICWFIWSSSNSASEAARASSR